MYKALVQTILNYDINVWGQAYETHFNSLKTTVNSLIKYLLKKPVYTDTN